MIGMIQRYCRARTYCYLYIKLRTKSNTSSICTNQEQHLPLYAQTKSNTSLYMHEPRATPPLYAQTKSNTSSICTNQEQHLPLYAHQTTKRPQNHWTEESIKRERGRSKSQSHNISYLLEF